MDLREDDMKVQNGQDPLVILHPSGHWYVLYRASAEPHGYYIEESHIIRQPGSFHNSIFSNVERIETRVKTRTNLEMPMAPVLLWTGSMFRQ